MSTQDRVKLPLSFDPSLLCKDLQQIENAAWIDHFVRQNYQGEWMVVPLRSPRGAEHPIRMIYSDPGCSDFMDTHYLERCSYFKQVLRCFSCELYAVRLMKLTPGSIIREHRDHDLAMEEGAVRLHIPLATSPEVEFKLNGKRVDMRVGECWYLRLSDLHSVNNRGTQDRIHLVIDAPVNDWMRDLINRGV